MAEHDSEPGKQRHLLDMSRRASECSRFKWRPGMVDIKGRIIVSASDDDEDANDYERLVCKDGQTWVDTTPEQFCDGPDLSHPATKGWVREFLPPRTIIIGASYKGRWCVTSPGFRTTWHESEEDALLCALERGGKRDPSPVLNCPFCNGACRKVGQDDWTVSGTGKDPRFAIVAEHECYACGRSIWA